MHKTLKPKQFTQKGEVRQTNRPTIGYLTTDWAWGTDPLQPNGCAWYRCVLPGIELEKRGWVTGVGIPGFNERDGFGLLTGESKAIHGWDIIVFKLIMHRDALEKMDQAIELGQKIVVDVDDFFDGLDESNRAHSVTDPKNNPDNNREIYAEIIKKSFAIITSTQFLFDYYSTIHKNVFLVRNGIDIDRYKYVKNQKRQYHKTKKIGKYKKTKIGWVGATPWRSNDLEILSPFIGEYISSQNIGFHHSGHIGNAGTAAEKLNINKELVSITPLRPIGEYPSLLGPIDIGIVPLNDVPFNHAKSFIKGLEYAAAGVPFIASDLPEYRYLFDAGIGRLATTKDEWIYHFDELLNDELRIDEAEINFEALSEFSMAKRGDDWEATMNFILEQAM